MLPSKKLNPFKKSVASIAKASPNKPQYEAQVAKKLFFPTFDSKESIIFWVVFVIFFSLLGVLSNTALFESRWDAWVFFIEGLLSYACIVMSVVGCVHVYRYSLADYNYAQTIKFFLKLIVLIVPIATLVSSLLTYLITGVAREWQVLLGFIASNVLLTAIFAYLLIHFFASQYNKMQQHQAIYQQKLIEKNEQLKARMSPHFFFNMLNTMQQLIETDPYEAEQLVQNVSTLYRASFDDSKEVALLDEIELCQRYLQIEKYRFDEKLTVTWQLPDEDMLYDMVISSLTLQLVIEKMIVMVVEMTTEQIALNILIEWVNDQVTIEVSVNIPSNVYETVTQNLDKNLSFDSQSEILRQYFGKTATIDYDYWIGQVTTYIRYPLKDVGY